MRFMNCTALAAALTILAGGGVAAQDRPPTGPTMAPDAETVLALRDRLELTDEQVEALHRIRRERLEARSSRREAMDELRSRLRAGEITRQEMRASVAEICAEGPRGPDGMRAPLLDVLSAEQLSTLQEVGRNRQALRRGGGQMSRGRGDAVRGPGRSQMRGRGIRPGVGSTPRRPGPGGGMGGRPCNPSGPGR